MRYLLIITLYFCFTITLYAQTRLVDSLQRVLGRQGLHDTIRILTTLELAYETRYIKADTSRKLALESLEKAQKINFSGGIAMGLYVQGIGFSLKGKYQEALENYFQSLDIYEKIKAEKGIARTLNNIAIVYYYQKNYEKADVFLKKSLAINEKIQNHPETARTLNNLGRNEIERNHPEVALDYFKKSLALLEKHRINAEVSVYYCNVAEALYQLKKPQEALKNAEKSFVLAQKAGNKRVEARACIVQGAIYLELNDMPKAQQFLEQGTPIARNLKFPEEHLLALEYSYRLYEKMNNFPRAYQFLKSYKAYSDTVGNETSYKIALQREYEYNEQKQKLKTAYEEEQRKTERQNEFFIRYLLIAGVVLALGTVFFALRAFRIKSKAFKIISQHQEEIVNQRNFIEAQNKNLSQRNEQIKQSIETALTIQQALLPFESRVEKLLKAHFVLYMPRDIVSGDFYWIEKIADQTMIVVADCTGHGVPGAFMSLIAINCLDEIVLQKGVTRPADILHDLHNLVRIVLKQDEVESNSGMDLGIISMEIQLAYTHLYFAGAKRPLYYISAENPTIVQTLKGCRKSIGGTQNETLQFTQEELTLPAQSRFYLSSDGLADQNDFDRKRLGERAIQQILLENQTSMALQKTVLMEVLQKHMTNTTQRDDILFLGVEV